MKGEDTIDSWKIDSLYPQQVHRQESLSMNCTCSIPNQGQRLPYRLWNDDAVTGILIVCMVTMLLLIAHNWRALKQQAKTFFMPPRERGALFQEESDSEQNVAVWMTLILSIMGALLTYSYVFMDNPLILDGMNPLWLLLWFFLSCLVYFLVKYITAKFVNWVFFPKVKKNNWKASLSFVICAENILFFPIILVELYADVSVHWISILLLILVVLCKILWLFRVYRIFFDNLYGLLHLFVYFCALEVMPVLVLLRVLIYITQSLVVK